MHAHALGTEYYSVYSPMNDAFFFKFLFIFIFTCLFLIL